MEYSDDGNDYEEESEYDEKNAPAKKRWGNQNEPIGEPIVLEPDHPLMQKFQETYKSCLLKENERLNTEIIELKESLKKRRRDYERQMGREMYQLEQEVSYQRKIIQEYEVALEKASKDHIENEAAVKEARDLHKEKNDILMADKKKDAELRGELEALTLLSKQYEAWQKETDSELAINQRISEKLMLEKKALSEEKKNTDMIVYKLTTEVWNLETQLELMEDQIKIKNEELEVIRNRSADSETDLEALQVEQNHLIKLWNSVIVNIGKKDKIFVEIQKDIENVKSEIQTVVANIESYKRDTVREMQRNEELTKMKEKVAYKLAEIKREIEKEEVKRLRLESSLMENADTLELTEKDLNIAKGENTRLSNKFNGISLQYDKIVDEKIRLENDTLDKLQERLSCDKTSESIAHQIRQLKEKSRIDEINILKNENKNAKILFQVERQKVKNQEILGHINDEKKIYDETKRELSIIENKIKEGLWNIDKVENNLDILNKKIYIHLNKNEGKEITPIERKIEELQNMIEEQTAKAKELQENWLRMQSNIVQLTKQLQKCVSEINLTKEQIRILENKRIKLDNTINTQKQDANEMKHTLESLQNQINHLSKQANQNRELNDELEAKYNALTFEYSAKLKDAEMDAINAEEEISALEEDKVQLANDLHRVKREALQWQNMSLMAAETRERVNKDRSSGDTGQMKSEIHRMQVRKSQVQTTAARLASDLALAVGRRTAATSRARASSKSSAPRHMILAKIKEKRLDVQRLNQEIQINKSLIENSTKERQNLQRELDNKRAILEKLEEELSELRQHVMENQILKQKNLERIVRHQRYGKHCSLILSGHARMLSVKSEPTVDVEFEKQKKINSQLTAAVEKLLVDMPEYELNLKRALNTLRVDDD